MIFFWVALYGTVFAVSESMSAALNVFWLTPLTMTAYIVFLITWSLMTGQAEALGLALPQLRKKDIPFLFPLLLFPLCNLLLTGPPLPSPATALLTLSACTAEELFFRGFLLSFLVRRIGRRSITAVSALFALLHLANLLSGWPPDYVAAQALFSFAAGFYFCITRIRSKSLIPCVIGHFLTNITAGDIPSVHQTGRPVFWFLCSAALLACGFLIYYKIPVKMEDYS